MLLDREHSEFIRPERPDYLRVGGDGLGPLEDFNGTIVHQIGHIRSPISARRYASYEHVEPRCIKITTAKEHQELMKWLQPRTWRYHGIGQVLHLNVYLKFIFTCAAFCTDAHCHTRQSSAAFSLGSCVLVLKSPLMHPVCLNWLCNLFLTLHGSISKA